MATAPDLPALGVVIVSYRSGGELPDALESLLAARDVRLSIALVENASPGDTVAQICDWATGRQGYQPAPNLPFQPIPQPKPLPLDGTPLPSGHRITLIRPATPGRIARHPGLFALLGNRVLYLEARGRIQIDGGTLDRRTGVTGNLHLGQPAKAARLLRPRSSTSRRTA